MAVPIASLLSLPRPLRWLLFFCCLFASSLEATRADISLVVIDLKYNEEQGVKICEIQPGSVSAFQHSRNRGADIANYFLDLLEKYWEPSACCLMPTTGDLTLRRKMFERGWQRRIPNPQTLAVHRQREGEGASTNPSDLSFYLGAIYSRLNSIKYRKNATHRFWPEFLFIDRVTAYRIRNKSCVHKLLRSRPELAVLRPRCGIYPAQYSKKITSRILDELSSKHLVIKPPNACRGMGVIIVERERLDEVLQKLFNREVNGPITEDQEDYLYWKRRQISHFLVEEFIASEPVALPAYPGEHFDPTLRVVAALIYDKGEIEIHFPGKYWKFPPKGLSTKGSLNEQHKSKANRPFSVEVSPHIWDPVREALTEWLRSFYWYLLSTSEE